jgi:hypothetical protein
VVSPSVVLGPCNVAIDFNELVTRKVGCAFEFSEERFGPGNEALDASHIAAMIIGCIRVIAGPNEIPVHSINPTAIVHVHIADG